MTQGHFDSKKAQRLDNEGRIRELRPAQLLTEVGGVIPGMTCVDLGYGTGTFAIPLAECVGNEGIVYAVDDSEEMLGYLRAKNPPSNVKLLQRDVTDTGLADKIADFCLLAFILHEVKQPQAVIAEAFRLLKPGGKALVVEWKADLDSPGPPRNIRISRDRLEELLTQAGFGGFSFVGWTGNHYAEVGVKPAGGRAGR